MKQLSIFFLLVISLNVALGKSFRLKRQSNSDENELDNRYSWDGPSWNRRSQGEVRWNWPNQSGNQWPQLPQTSRPETLPPAQPNQTQTPPPQATTPGTALQSVNVQQCIRRCPTLTSEYNPVCGTNMFQYFNPSHLECAKRYCGVNVDLMRASRCPPSTK